MDLDCYDQLLDLAEENGLKVLTQIMCEGPHTGLNISILTLGMWMLMDDM